MKKWILFVGACLPCLSACSSDSTTAADGGKSNGATTSGGGTETGGASGSGTGSSTTSTGGAGTASNSGGASTNTNGGSTGSVGMSGTGVSTGNVATSGTTGSSTSATTGSTSDTGSTSSSTGGTSGGGLPPLTVDGNHLKDPTGKTIVLRGSSLIDIGSIYAYGGQNDSAIANRMDKIAAAGVQGHVVRMPVYPKITYNGNSPTCSPVPYPVGTGPTASCTPKAPLNASDYVTKVLKPAVDYATSKSLYVIIDYHQIDNATTGTSAADATTFWTDIAPKFASYTNVLYEPFNEPIDNKTTWAALKPVVQGFIDTIRAGAPNNVIIVPSNSWDQRPGDAASDPPNGTNLMYTAHIYPNNWNQTFQNQVATAIAKAPVFISEWGYTDSTPNAATWGTDLETLVDGNGASFTAWVTDNAWQPNMFSDMALTQLTDFGTLVKTWLAAKANSDWVQ